MKEYKFFKKPNFISSSNPEIKGAYSSLLFNVNLAFIVVNSRKLLLLDQIEFMCVFPCLRPR